MPVLTPSLPLSSLCVFGGEGEFHNEIHTKRVPLQVWDPERVQFTYWSLSYWFCPKAEVTGADVLSDIPRYLRPPVVSRYQLQCFPASGERDKRDIDCDKQIEKAVTAPNCMLKGSWGEGGSGGIRKKLKSEYAAYLESNFRRNDGSSI